MSTDHMNMDRVHDGSPVVKLSTEEIKDKGPNKLDKDVSNETQNAVNADLSSSKNTNSTSTLGRIGKAFSKLGRQGLDAASESSVGKSIKTSITEALAPIKSKEAAKETLIKAKEHTKESLIKTVDDIRIGVLSVVGLRESSSSKKMFSQMEIIKNSVAPQDFVPLSEQNLKPRFEETKPAPKPEENPTPTQAAAKTTEVTLSPEELEKLAKTSTHIRGEMISTENTFTGTLDNCSKRLQALIDIKGGEKDLTKLEILLPENPNEGVPIDENKAYRNACKDHVKDLKKKLENVTVEELQEIKTGFDNAKESSKQLFTDLKTLHEGSGDSKNEKVGNIYKDFFQEGSVYVDSLAQNAKNYPKLLALDVAGGPNYITSVQRLPRHRMLVEDLGKNSTGKDNDSLQSSLELIKSAAGKVNQASPEEITLVINKPRRITKAAGESIEKALLNLGDTIEHAANDSGAKSALKGVLNVVGERGKVAVKNEEFLTDQDKFDQLNDKIVALDKPAKIEDLKALTKELVKLTDGYNPLASDTRLISDYAYWYRGNTNKLINELYLRLPKDVDRADEVEKIRKILFALDDILVSKTPNDVPY